jgi:hypothetical protein
MLRHFLYLTPKGEKILVGADSFEGSIDTLTAYGLMERIQEEYPPDELTADEARETGLWEYYWEPEWNS